LVEFWDGVTQILVVAIPTGIGAIATGFGVHWWQVKKEKFLLKTAKYDLRKEIQDKFQEAVVERVNLCRFFVTSIYEHFLVGYRISPTEELKIEFGLRVPPNSPLNLETLFKNEIKEFEETYHNLTKKVWAFGPSIEIYFDSEKLRNEFKILKQQQFFAHQVIKVLIYSKDRKDFNENYSVYKYAQKNLQNSTGRCSRLLANTSLKESPD